MGETMKKRNKNLQKKVKNLSKKTISKGFTHHHHHHLYKKKREKNNKMRLKILQTNIKFNIKVLF
jgi:hypothetical protein